ncbi:MAG: NAD(P)-dependent oxidoreductase [Candidatus Pacearchaeota archaeon]
MNILVTGYEGFLGNSLVGRLKSLENLVVGFDKGENKNLKYTPDVVVNGDIRDTDLLKKVVADYKIQEVYHFAGQAIAGKCFDNPYGAFDINVMGIVSLFEACRTSRSIRSIVVSNSNKIFGDSPAPYNEETLIKPKHVYDTTKACQRLVSLCYFHDFQLPIKVMICTNIYGPGDLNLTTRVIPNNITRLLNGDKAQLGDAVRKYEKEFIYIDDAIEAFMTIARKGKSGEVYCCGGTTPISLEDLIKKICELTGKRFPEDVESFTKPMQFTEATVQSMNVKKLKSLGWEPKVTLEEGLTRTIDYYRQLLKK